METRALCLMLLVLLAGSSGIAEEHVTLSQNRCVVPANLRLDCGYPGIQVRQCIYRGCCFDPSIRYAPKCFVPRQNPE